MNTLLIDGSFTPDEAEELLTKLFQVKKDFHMQRIDTSKSSEEDIKHSEKRIKKLETDLKDIVGKIKSSGHERIIL